MVVPFGETVSSVRSSRRMPCGASVRSMPRRELEADVVVAGADRAVPSTTEPSLAWTVPSLARLDDQAEPGVDAREPEDLRPEEERASERRRPRSPGSTGVAVPTGSGGARGVASLVGSTDERRLDREVGGVDAPVEAFGSDEEASSSPRTCTCPTGATAVAVLPLTVSGTGALPAAFHQKTGFDCVPAGSRRSASASLRNRGARRHRRRA